MAKKSLHSICRWTFNPGKGGFVPGDMRPEWGADAGFGTPEMIKLVGESIKPRMPNDVELGIELHYDAEVDESNATAVADALSDNGLHLAMITPGAHCHFGYGGIASLDPKERAAAEELGTKTVDLAYGPLKKAWHPSKEPSLIVWNGSFGYDIATKHLRKMYQNLKESMAHLCDYEKSKGGDLYIGFEPKPNEGHPAMLIPTVASALLFWRRIEDEFGVPRAKKGVNKEFGHSEMIGLDHVYDTVEELDNDAMVHMHINSQGYNDGCIMGGPGKYDIDHGARINAMNVAIAGLIQDAAFDRWKGHDMQTRSYDNAEQGINRVVRSVISWEACERAARKLKDGDVLDCLVNRDTAGAEDMMHDAVMSARRSFKAMYKG